MLACVVTKDLYVKVYAPNIPGQIRSRPYQLDQPRSDWGLKPVSTILPREADISCLPNRDGCLVLLLANLESDSTNYYSLRLG